MTNFDDLSKKTSRFLSLTSLMMEEFLSVTTCILLLNSNNT
ncbi:hypothetical protein QUF74_18530 [Candidatus Halobeggiatoa sp. HSG11]|nr:hypothetical protein [Candidatus Halobeggiatoa sp. HSG11]